MSKKNQKSSGLDPAAIIRMAQQLTPAQQIELMQSMGYDPFAPVQDPPLNTARMEKCLAAVKKWAQDPAATVAALPMDEISKILYHSTAESHMRAMYELGSVNAALEALSKLFDQKLPPSNLGQLEAYVQEAEAAPKLNDKNDSGNTFKAKCALLLSVGECIMHTQNRADATQENRILPFVLAVMHRSQNDTYVLTGFKSLSEISLDAFGASSLYSLGGLKLFADPTKGLKDVRPTVTTVIGGSQGDKHIVYSQMQTSLLSVSLRGLTILLSTHELSQMELIQKHDILRKLQALKPKDSSARMMLQQMITALGGQVQFDASTNPHPFHKLTPEQNAEYHAQFDQESNVLKCSYCGKAGTAEQPLKKCSGCKKVQYCSRECQLAQWKVHKPQCSK